MYVVLWFEWSAYIRFASYFNCQWLSLVEMFPFLVGCSWSIVVVCCLPLELVTPAGRDCAEWDPMMLRSDGNLWYYSTRIKIIHTYDTHNSYSYKSKTKKYYEVNLVEIVSFLRASLRFLRHQRKNCVAFDGLQVYDPIWSKRQWW